MLGQRVFWYVSPSFARHAILQALSVWVETPTSCGHIFLVPRLLQRDYGRLSKFVFFSNLSTKVALLRFLVQAALQRRKLGDRIDEAIHTI